MIDGEGWLRIKRGSAYMDVGVRTFRDLLKNGLKHIRLPSGTILVKREWIDEYLESFTKTENQVDEIVSEVCKGL